MKQWAKYIIYSLLFLIVGLTLNPAMGYAQKTQGTIEADMGIMDDFGNILADYTKEEFVIRDGLFIYREPPLIDRYTFATANVLKIETDKGATYRVNYFYTLDSTEPGLLPEPFPLVEMPMKKAPIEKVKFQVAWTDESMRELAGSEVRTLDYFWDAYVIPLPKLLKGYGFMRLETGRKLVDGVEIPQLVYIYKKDSLSVKPVSLIFGHLLGERTIATIKPENPPNPSTSPAAPPQTKPVTKPQTKPVTKPVTKPSEFTTPAKTGPGGGSPVTGPTTGQSTAGDKTSTAGTTSPGLTQTQELPEAEAVPDIGSITGILLAGVLILAALIYPKLKK